MKNNPNRYAGFTRDTEQVKRDIAKAYLNIFATNGAKPIRVILERHPSSCFAEKETGRTVKTMATEIARNNNLTDDEKKEFLDLYQRRISEKREAENSLKEKQIMPEQPKKVVASSKSQKGIKSILCRLFGHGKTE